MATAALGLFGPPIVDELDLPETEPDIDGKSGQHELALEEVVVRGMATLEPESKEKAKPIEVERQERLKEADKIAGLWRGRCLSNWTKGEELAWECAAGHKWKAARAAIVERYEWCADCPGSREARSRVILEHLLDAKFPKARPDWLRSPKTGHLLELDGYNAELGLAFEHQGRQHYMVVSVFHPKGEDDLKRQRERDAEKADLCTERRIAALIIPYYVWDLAAWLRRELESLGYLLPRKAKALREPPIAPK